MPLWIGRPGALLRLRAPLRGATVTPDFGGVVHEAIGGARTVDLMGDGRRVWSFSWRSLPRRDAALLRGLAGGHYGPGPYVMYDPGQRNLLTANQSSGTDAAGTVDGFEATTGAWGPNRTASAQGTGCLGWELHDLPGPGEPDPTVRLLWRHGPHGIPVVPDQRYTFSAQLSGTSTALRLRLALVWRDAAGAVLSTTNGPATAPAGVLGAFAAKQVSGLPPAGAVYVGPRIVAAVPVADTVIGADAMQLELGAATAWEPGYGLPLVSITELPAAYAWADYHDLQMTLVEVG